jgi:integrase
MRPAVEVKEKWRTNVVTASRTFCHPTLQTYTVPWQLHSVNGTKVRDIDVSSGLAAFISKYIANRASGFLFQTKAGKPLTQRNVHRNSLSTVRKILNLQQDGKGFHAFRRFRAAHLRKNRVPWDLEKLWLGHANKTVTDKYAEQVKEDVEWRKEVAEKTGLGFALPNVQLGYLGYRTKKLEAARAE